MYISTEGDLTKDPIPEDVLKFNMTISNKSVPFNEMFGIEKVSSGTSNILMNANVSASISNAVSRASSDFTIKNIDLLKATVEITDKSTNRDFEVTYAE